MSVANRVTVIVPVKRWELSKSRLDVGAVARPLLARAFTLDVLAAVDASRHVREVVVVTSEPGLSTAEVGLESHFVADGPLGSRDGLNSAIVTGIRRAARRHPDSPLLVLPADLPALTSGVLDEAVDLLSLHDSAFVPDADGDGTTMSWGASPEHVKVAYGAGSAHRHTALGAHAVGDASIGARLDVDTVQDLERARRLGVGSNTAATLQGLAGRVLSLRR